MKKTEKAPFLPPKPPEHRVTRREWDNTMRAALAGLIASGKQFGDGSYGAVVMQARIYAQAAHGERP